eukprot:scaffold281403_cov46-Attheya_sp.AAC.1
MSAKEEDASLEHPPVDYNNNNDKASSLYYETKEEEDYEGLLVKGYQVVLCGTGLVQSILASALARAGLDTLHCDAMPYYGEFDTVLKRLSIEMRGAALPSSLMNESNDPI